ncbi:hypothetical protein AVEN_120822-1 [Araneus ventricosus]|uniref:Uncharacterized protein n=1 Tax=Araneus ventricosus TaxID=182803 RepID=A0A4Y2FAE4_ARAVE|nr:hypothetical protein AVEN_120822-1 [Araneus ventricosus]
MVRSLQAKWRGRTPHQSDFQPIHLDGSSTQAPCKRSLLFPRAVTPTPQPAFKRDTSCCSDPPSSTGLHFVLLTSVRDTRSPSPRSHFNFITQNSKWITIEVENPKFSTALY